jgi:hypothetical protein
MANAAMTQDYDAPSHLWSVHSETDGMPVIRAWTRSEAEAQSVLEELKASDEDAAKTQYWVLRLTHGEVEQFKASGFIPHDA